MMTSSNPMMSAERAQLSEQRLFLLGCQLVERLPRLSQARVLQVAFLAAGAAHQHRTGAFRVVFGQRRGAFGGFVVGVGMQGEHAKLLRIHLGTISPAPQLGLAAT
jgi:hypothetical protein